MKKLKDLEEKAENFIIFIHLVWRLFKIIVFQKENKISFNKLMLLANKEYYVASNVRRTFSAYDRISSKDIHKKIAINYKAFKNSKNFKTKIKYVKNLNYHISQLDQLKIIRSNERFMQNLMKDLKVIIKERVEKQHDKQGQIEEDLRSLEGLLNLKEIYKKKLEEEKHLL